MLSDAEGMGERSGDLLARHSNDPLLSQIHQGVARLDAERGRAFDATSENISASLYALAKANGLTQVDHVLLSDRTAQADVAQSIFIVQGSATTRHSCGPACQRRWPRRHRQKSPSSALSSCRSLGRRVRRMSCSSARCRSSPGRAWPRAASVRRADVLAVGRW